eukprot:6208196-Pleurochrysis_carterae.AAC.3
MGSRSFEAGALKLAKACYICTRSVKYINDARGLTENIEQMVSEGAMQASSAHAFIPSKPDETLHESWMRCCKYARAACVGTALTYVRQVERFHACVREEGKAHVPHWVRACMRTSVNMCVRACVCGSLRACVRQHVRA